MPVTYDMICNALDATYLFELDFSEEIVKKVDFMDNVTLIFSDTLQHPMVFPKNLSEDQIDTVIHEVKAYFSEDNQTFGWDAHENSKPSNLLNKLDETGFEISLRGHGMVLYDLNHDISVNPDVTIKIATPEDHEEIVRVISEAFPLPEVRARGVVKFQNALNARYYLAYIDGEKKPVSVATMFYYPQASIAALQGAATLEAFRGQGIYTALVASRLDQARKDNIEAVVVQADATTSAPIMAKLGFEKVLDLRRYVFPASSAD